MRLPWPRWEALRKRYSGQGLKLVVINIDDYESDTQCKSLPWHPDLLKCSPELAKQLGVRRVPQAFVWSWQGNLLVQGESHIDEVERALREYFDRHNPRVVVEAVGPHRKARRKLRRLIESALGRDDKLTLVTDRSERRRLAALRQQSPGLARREDQQCEPGQEISANTRLLVEDFGDTVSLAFQDVESGKCGITITADWEAVPLLARQDEAHGTAGPELSGAAAVTAGLEGVRYPEFEWDLFQLLRLS